MTSQLHNRLDFKLIFLENDTIDQDLFRLTNSIYVLCYFVDFGEDIRELFLSFNLKLFVYDPQCFIITCSNKTFIEFLTIRNNRIKIYNGLMNEFSLIFWF